MKCIYCGCEEFDCDYEDKGYGFDMHSLFSCMNCGAMVTVYEADREPEWTPGEIETELPIPTKTGDLTVARDTSKDRVNINGIDITDFRTWKEFENLLTSQQTEIMYLRDALELACKKLVDFESGSQESYHSAQYWFDYLIGLAKQSSDDPRKETMPKYREGDKVWCIYYDSESKEKFRVVSFIISNIAIFYNDGKYGTPWGRLFKEEELYLTKEEAEEALKKCKE